MNIDGLIEQNNNQVNCNQKNCNQASERNNQQIQKQNNNKDVKKMNIFLKKNNENKKEQKKYQTDVLNRRKPKRSSLLILGDEDDFLTRINAKDLSRFEDSLRNDFMPCFVTTEFLLLKNTNSFAYLSKKNQKSGKCYWNNDFVKHIFEGLLSDGSNQILGEQNAGGNSVNSEVLSFEILHRMFGFQLMATEMQIVYNESESKKTDYCVCISKHLIGDAEHFILNSACERISKKGKNKDTFVFGVSVTRAMNFLGEEYFTDAHAQILLQKKLNGVLLSSQSVTKKFKWRKQILHVFCQSRRICNMLKNNYRKISSSLRANTMLLCTVVQNDAEFIFYERKL